MACDVMVITRQAMSRLGSYGGFNVGIKTEYKE